MERRKSPVDALLSCCCCHKMLKVKGRLQVAKAEAGTWVYDLVFVLQQLDELVRHIPLWCLFACVCMCVRVRSFLSVLD